MPRILIAGGGIGGLAAALALARIGATVTVFERAPKLEETGAGIQLSPNATRVLAGLGVLGALSRHAFKPQGIRVRTARSGRVLAFMPLEDAERRWGSPYVVIRRAELQAVLAEALASEPVVSLHLDASVAGFGTTAKGVTATVRQNGITRVVDGDALIGADGIRSTVRTRLVDGDDAPRETGRTAWRTLVPAADVDPLFRASETGLWLGRDAHLVHYPVRGDRLLNVVAIIRDTPGRASGNLWSTPGDPATIQARFEAWHTAVRGLIAGAPVWTTWPLFDRTPLAAWHAGPVALLGDAAHPILPFLAQGSAQAIEDAAALAEAIASTCDISDALAHYSLVRHARVTRVQETSRRLGRLYHLSGPACAARNIGMRLLGGRRLLHRYDWLYGVQRQRT